MRWRGISSEKSIFDSEEQRISRPLTALEKSRVVSKYTAIVALICLTPFLSADRWEASQLYRSPLEKSFKNVNLRLGGGGKSPPVIVLTYRGKRVFVSPCDGLKEVVCREDYSGEPAFVDIADVTEISPGKGIIKRLSMHDKFGKKIVVTNHYADTWAQSYPRNPYQKNWFLLIIATGAALVFFALKSLSFFINFRSREK